MYDYPGVSAPVLRVSGTLVPSASLVPASGSVVPTPTPLVTPVPGQSTASTGAGAVAGTGAGAGSGTGAGAGAGGACGSGAPCGGGAPLGPPAPLIVGGATPMSSQGAMDGNGPLASASEDTVRLSQAVADLQALADSRLGEVTAIQSRLEATLKEVEDLRSRVMVRAAAWAPQNPHPRRSPVTSGFPTPS